MSRRYSEPWTFRDDLFDDRLNPCVLDANGDAVCSVEYRGDEDEQESSGRLIAAAPRLLEVLRAALDECGAVGSLSLGTLAQGREIIALVEGRDAAL